MYRQSAHRDTLPVPAHMHTRSHARTHLASLARSAETVVRPPLEPGLADPAQTSNLRRAVCLCRDTKIRIRTRIQSGPAQQALSRINWGTITPSPDLHPHSHCNRRICSTNNTSPHALTCRTGCGSLSCSPGAQEHPQCCCKDVS